MTSPLPRIRFVALSVLVVTLAGCSSTPQPAVSAATSAQPDVDSAVVDTRPERFASALTVLDDETNECLTTIALIDEQGVSAFVMQSAIDLLRAAGEDLECQPVVRVVRDDGAVVDLAHLTKYVPSRSRDGDLLID